MNQSVHTFTGCEPGCDKDIRRAKGCVYEVQYLDSEPLDSVERSQKRAGQK